MPPSFLTYETEDFLQNDSFCNYCKGIDPVAVTFWEQWTRENPGRAKYVRQAKEIYFLLNGNITQKDFRNFRHQFTQSFDAHLQEKTIPITSNAIFRYTRHLAVAASMLVLITLAFFWWQRHPATAAKQIFISKAGERKSFQLPDGSTVTLNGDSRLTLEQGFSTANRQMQLSGEAFFNIVANPAIPAIIHAGIMEVKVLGTSFNLKAYPEDNHATASLISGRILVAVPGTNHQKVLLSPNDKLVVSTTEPALTAIATHTTTIVKLDTTQNNHEINEVSWVHNRLYIDNQTLADAAKLMERWYGVTIEVDPTIANTYRYTASFEHETLEQALKAMQSSLAFQYSIIGNKIYINQ
ncbi:ferric-dicitrate binding protein FerR (iron transport regulator) [Chitinophaga dinghuensis]|uniref:Ferric-dicitrate binding protein FerR (Iron transport regulator) n=1 Tax=Chitinophaga dinghuensis TaxID=1539050 RepID=A0A327VXT0_9BACT|nr:FecR domain-containing protein [Chitinophaga dinghuensis]RAJ81841.1 ferric-dicitrate binding protein FerR (iron transport regulator) [Chitinophaga dinghuensis]